MSTASERELPKVLVAVLVKQKQKVLDYYLETLLAWDYPKNRIHLYIRTNNNTDATEEILRKWVENHGHLYGGLTFDSSNVSEPVEQFGVHEWNPMRYSVLGRIREASMQAALDNHCDFYFVSDVDNFLLPATLRVMVSRNLPIIAPLLRYAVATPTSPDPSDSPTNDYNNSSYSNYHNKVNKAGYFEMNDFYPKLLMGEYMGIHIVDLVHCTYLIKARYIPYLKYIDGTSRHEYVIFSDSARKARIPQYLDNTAIFGCLTLMENAPACKEYMNRIRDLAFPGVEKN